MVKRRAVSQECRLAAQLQIWKTRESSAVTLKVVTREMIRKRNSLATMTCCCVIPGIGITPCLGWKLRGSLHRAEPVVFVDRIWNGKLAVIDPMVTPGNAGNRLMESGTGVREVLEKEAGSRMRTWRCKPFHWICQQGGISHEQDWRPLGANESETANSWT